MMDIKTYRTKASKLAAINYTIKYKLGEYTDTYYASLYEPTKSKSAEYPYKVRVCNIIDGSFVDVIPYESHSSKVHITDNTLYSTILYNVFRQYYKDEKAKKAEADLSIISAQEDKEQQDLIMQELDNL
jgi:hypothetical protein